MRRLVFRPLIFAAALLSACNSEPDVELDDQTLNLDRVSFEQGTRRAIDDVRFGSQQDFSLEISGSMELANASIAASEDQVEDLIRGQLSYDGSLLAYKLVTSCERTSIEILGTETVENDAVRIDYRLRGNAKSSGDASGLWLRAAESTRVDLPLAMPIVEDWTHNQSCTAPCPGESQSSICFRPTLQCPVRSVQTNVVVRRISEENNAVVYPEYARIAEDNRIVALAIFGPNETALLDDVGIRASADFVRGLKLAGYQETARGTGPVAHVEMVQLQKTFGEVTGIVQVFTVLRSKAHDRAPFVMRILEAQKSDADLVMLHMHAYDLPRDYIRNPNTWSDGRYRIFLLNICYGLAYTGNQLFAGHSQDASRLDLITGRTPLHFNGHRSVLPFIDRVVLNASLFKRGLVESPLLPLASYNALIFALQEHSNRRMGNNSEEWVAIGVSENRSP